MGFSLKDWLTDKGDEEVNAVSEEEFYTVSKEERFMVGVSSDSAPQGWYAYGNTLFNEVSTTTVMNQGISIWNNNMTEYGYCDADVLAELVTMNPQKIEIKGKEEFLKTEIAGVITAVFEDRIYYK